MSLANGGQYFIKTDLNMPEMENAEIERAHRMKSGDPNKCTIIVIITKFKDKDYYTELNVC